MASSLSHTFDGRSWRIIKEFTGIYGVKMDYTKITKLSRDKLSKAYFVAGKQPRSESSILVPIQYDIMGNAYTSHTTDKMLNRALKRKSASEWKALILKWVAQGYKNRQFYEAVAKMVAPPPKVTCVCGLKIGHKEHQQYNHYRTRAHVNRMLKCVPVSKVADSKVPVWDRMGNSHTLVVRKWSNHQRQFLVKQIDLRPYMEQRERFKDSRTGAGGFVHYTMDDILAGGWVPGW
jgi:hypothetical protein